MDSIKGNLKICEEKIAETAIKCGRDPKEIILIPVTKSVSPERINEGIDAGIKIIGENKVQETREKIEYVKPVCWHMIGHLQTNKVKYAVKLYDMIQSVDSLHLAKEINKRAVAMERIIPILIEVNTSGEKTKFGCQPEETLQLVSYISELSNVSVKGLMTIGVFSSEEQIVRPCFIRLRNIAEKIKSEKISNIKMDILSMGMSADFNVAIEEGSTMVRIGTAIFGPRSYKN